MIAAERSSDTTAYTHLTSNPFIPRDNTRGCRRNHRGGVGSRQRPLLLGEGPMARTKVRFAKLTARLCTTLTKTPRRARSPSSSSSWTPRANAAPGQASGRDVLGHASTSLMRIHACGGSRDRHPGVAGATRIANTLAYSPNTRSRSRCCPISRNRTSTGWGCRPGRGAG